MKVPIRRGMQAFDFYSPVALILGGALGLGYWGLLGRFLKNRPQSYVTERIERVHQRFAARSRLSWVMIVFGALWMLQVVVEQSLAKGTLLAWR